MAPPPSRLRNCVACGVLRAFDVLLAAVASDVNMALLVLQFAARAVKSQQHEQSARRPECFHPALARHLGFRRGVHLAYW